MPTTVAEMQILLEARDAATPHLQALGKQVQAVERQVESASGAFGRMRGLLGGLGQLGLAGMGAGTIISGFQTALGAVTGLVTSASDLNEQISRSGQVFGEASTQVTEFARTTALALGISRTEALEAAGNFGQLFRTAGVSGEQAAGMSTRLVELAGDLASFNNIATGDALAKLRSGLVGEAEPLRELGILLSEDAVAAEALASGLAETTKEITDADRVQARFNIILRQSASAQGDFQRTSTGLANSMRIIRAAFADIRTTLGAALLPTATRLIQGFVQQLPAIAAAVQGFADQVAPILERVFSGDLTGGLQEVAARLAPILATWSEAFWGWVRDMTPELLRRLGVLAGDLFAWIKEQGPPFLERFIGEWVPQFVDWVVKVLPPLLLELGKIVKAVTDWATTTGKPELEALGLALGAALVAGFGKALEKLGPVLVEALRNALRSTGVGGGVAAGLPPGTEAVLPQVLPQVSAAAQAAAARAAGGGGTTNVVEVAPGAVVIDGVADPGAAEALRGVIQEALTDFGSSLASTAAYADPGASARLQGAPR